MMHESQHDEHMLVHMTQAVDNLYTKTAQFRPSIENLDELVVDLKLNHDAFKVIKTTLNESKSLSLDAVRTKKVSKSYQLEATEPQVSIVEEIKEELPEEECKEERKEVKEKVTVESLF